MKFLSKNTFVMLILFSATGIWLAAHSENKRQALVRENTPQNDQPEELGHVRWLRNMDEARQQASKSGKPILILFQEVPGCITCRNYGNNILRHPLIVEAIETSFVPLAIYNNKQGEDAKVLRFFNEPAWNNPVVRIVNAEKQDIVPRLGNDYSAYGLVNTMLLALNNANRVAPEYLRLLGEELQAKAAGTETATLAMYCFWTGEKELGKLPGVVSTEAGFMDGKEVVRVKYSPTVLSYDVLLQEAKKSNCASYVFSENNTQQETAKRVVGKSSVSSGSTFRPDKEVKYYLSHTHWRFVPMTELQAARANSLVGQSKSPAELLSPRQIELASFIRKNEKKGWENAVGKDITLAWENAGKLWKPSSE
jgi:hypothetical protein